MSKNFKLNNFKQIIISILLIFLCAFTFNAQETQKPDAESDNLRNKNEIINKNTNDFEPIKYIVGESPAEFKKLLNEWGERGYKLFVSTKIPLTDEEQNHQQMILAAILKFDGEEKFRYEVLSAYNSTTAENLLNEFSQKGFQYRKSFWFTEGVKDSSNCDGDAISEILCRAIAMHGIRTGSVLLLEHRTGRKFNRTYRVLSGGTKIFIWEKSTATNLRENFNELLKDSFFIPVGLFYYQINSRDAVIVEIANDAEIEPKLQEKISYKIVRHESGSRFNKEIELLSKDGYRIIAKEKTFAVVARNEDDKTPISYSMVAAHRKKYLEEISRLANQGYKFSLVDYDDHSIDQFEGKLLFERKVNDDGRRFEYKSVKLTEKPQYPNKKVKQRSISPVSEKALDEFNKLVKEGYQIRALFYSHGIAVLLEKENTSEVISAKN